MPESWYGILESVRKRFHDGKPFTASDVADAAGIEKTALSSADKIAWAWVAKFLKWGYVRHVASTVGPSGRRVKTYAVTGKGEECVLQEGKLARLVAAVRAYQAARGTKGDAGAYAQLLKTADEVEARP